MGSEINGVSVHLILTIGGTATIFPLPCSYKIARERGRQASPIVNCQTTDLYVH